MIECRTTVIERAPEMPMPYEPIHCSDHDYIEIVCMDRSLVEVVLDEETKRGVAVDTRTNNDGEFLVLQMGDGAREEIRLDKIRKIIVLSARRRFDAHVIGARGD